MQFGNMIQTFALTDFHALCDELGERNKYLQSILAEYSYPPFWTRPNTFETLVLTILEQQVSLASAYAAYKKLKEKVVKISAQKILQLTDEELRGCYFSRQKIVYVRGLANAILTRQLNLKRFENEEDEVVRSALKELKGIGDWTVDIYLIHALQRTDIFPIGDLALVNAVRTITDKQLTKEEIISMAESWKPYRSIATMILWHYYIKKKNIKLLH
jgi:DNA-3-methyladenine glycosylase II